MEAWMPLTLSLNQIMCFYKEYQILSHENFLFRCPPTEMLSELTFQSEN